MVLIAPNIQMSTLLLDRCCGMGTWTTWINVSQNTMLASAPSLWSASATRESTCLASPIPLTETPRLSRDPSSTFEEEVSFARGVYDLCKQYNIPFVADEVRMGSCKTGKFFSFNHLGSDVRPDMLVIGKSMTGGAYPASFVLADAHLMSVVGPYESGSTFAHTPMAIAAAEAALAVLDEEDMARRAQEIGDKFTQLTESWRTHPHVADIQVRGADFSILIREDPQRRVTARRIGGLCLSKGLLLYPLEGRLRMSVSMVMSDEELERGCKIIKEALDEVAEYPDAIPGEVWHKA